MDRIRQKAKKDKPKYADNEKPPLFMTDIKTIKENLKIKEILRTVKMNSSMRVKAPRGSKVMQNKDFNDNDEFEDLSDEAHRESASATNSVLAGNSDIVEARNDDCVDRDENFAMDKCHSEDYIAVTTDNNNIQEVNESTNDGEEVKNESKQTIPEIKTTLVEDRSRIISRERKLSLDQTMWTRRQSLSQSEIDLYSIGKSPLERKSSFFRKKMDRFLKNTTEIFKKQTVSRSQSELVRRGSMSQSLQSLNDKNMVPDNNSMDYINQGSTASLQSSVAGQSTPSLVTSQASLVTSQDERLSPVPGDQESRTTGSVNSLNDAYLAQGLLSSRAISMSSGLDTAVKRRKRKTSLANRVTWLASETMNNYLKRVIPTTSTSLDDDNKDMSTCHSYQDLSSIPENQHGSKIDSKGRRLSYQRAVSGEDPVLPTRYSETSNRRRQGIPENPEADSELVNLLAEYSDRGVPQLKWFEPADIVREAFHFLQVAEKDENLDEIYDTKKLTPAEEARQAVVRELVVTEANYIKHLMAIVEVFIGAAHALQDAGKMLDIDTGQLFSNIPDVLNASLYFWEATIYPMLNDAMLKNSAFDTEQMSHGFCRFREIFNPYEKYVIEQSKVLDYLRSLYNNLEFMTYLTWCHGHKTCQRLQLSDILVKPMQRLTKYSLILRRIISHTDFEPERTSLMIMETYAKNYVLDINRSIRQKEELEKLDAIASSIDPYELEFKDEELDKYFRMYTQLHLKAPMMYSVPSHSRSLIFEGDLRFKDHVNTKEIEVHVVLLTDMILICKKQSKGLPLRLIRPKFMIDKIIHFPRWHRNLRDVVAIVFVVVDDVGSATFGFCFTESSGKQDPNLPPVSLRLWEQKVREARLSYDLGVWFARNPSRDLSEVEVDSSAEYAISCGSKPCSDDYNIEREARERVAAMLHRSIGASTDCDLSQASLTTDSFDGGASGPRSAGAHNQRHPMHRNSTGGSSRNSRLSSFQQSTSAASHDEPAMPVVTRPPHALRMASTEQAVPQITQEEGDHVVAITVNVVSESESETIVPAQQASPSSPSKLSARLSAHGPGPSSAGGSNTLRVQPQPVAHMHSLPDLTVVPSPPRPFHTPNPSSASEKLYQSHQELLHRNRLMAAQHHQYLTPDHRGSSYPPPSPTRGSLKRGLAFSYSFKNPPLTKMGHVNSQTQAEAGPSSNQQSPARSPSPMTAPSPLPGPSTEKSDKSDKIEKSEKKKHFSSRNKSGSRSPNRKDKEEKEDKADKGKKEDKDNKKDKGDKGSKSEKEDKKEKGDKGSKGDKEDKKEKGDKDGKGDKKDKGEPGTRREMGD